MATFQPAKDPYREQAKVMFVEPKATDGSVRLKVTDHAEVSKGNQAGAWVEAWLWVPDSELGKTVEYQVTRKEVGTDGS